jgi:hypothetical protein
MMSRTGVRPTEDGKEGGNLMIVQCTVMEHDHNSLPHEQGLLSCELLAIPAAGKK